MEQAFNKWLKLDFWSKVCSALAAAFLVLCCFFLAAIVVVFAYFNLFLLLGVAGVLTLVVMLLRGLNVLMDKVL